MRAHEAKTAMDMFRQVEQAALRVARGDDGEVNNMCHGHEPSWPQKKAICFL